MIKLTYENTQSKENTLKVKSLDNLNHICRKMFLTHHKFSKEIESIDNGDKYKYSSFIAIELGVFYRLLGIAYHNEKSIETSNKATIYLFKYHPDFRDFIIQPISIPSKIKSKEDIKKILSNLWNGKIYYEFGTESRILKFGTHTDNVNVIFYKNGYQIEEKSRFIGTVIDEMWTNRKEINKTLKVIHDEN